MLRGAGLVPFVPHLSWLAHIVSPAPYETWMTDDFAWLERCDALLRLPGESSGADREFAFAVKLGLARLQGRRLLVPELVGFRAAGGERVSTHLGASANTVELPTEADIEHIANQGRDVLRREDGRPILVGRDCPSQEQLAAAEALGRA